MRNIFVAKTVMMMTMVMMCMMNMCMFCYASVSDALSDKRFQVTIV